MRMLSSPRLCKKSHARAQQLRKKGDPVVHRMFRYLAIAAVAMCLGTRSFARDTPVVGAGSTQCSAYLAMSAADQLIIVSWAQGFLSGVNVGRATQTGVFLQLPEFEAVSAYYQSFCPANREKSIYLASTNFYKTLQGRARKLLATPR
jgi:HdeA/HdeB family